MRQVRSISRKDWFVQNQNPQRPYAEHPHRDVSVKIWSDLHGDMQSQAEMTWPLVGDDPAGGNNRVGPYPMQP